MDQEKKLPVISKEMQDKLLEGFPCEAYSPHPTKTYLTVLKAYYVTERLNEVFGVGRWEIQTKVVERTDDYVLVIGRFISHDYDVQCTEQYGGGKTTGKGTEIADGYKSAVTDCQSKIASYLGVGADLFKGKIKASKSNYTQEPTSSGPQIAIYDGYEARDQIKSKGGRYDNKVWFLPDNESNREFIKTIGSKNYKIIK